MTATVDDAAGGWVRGRNVRIMYVCGSCAEAYPEGCGHFDRADLVVMPDGRWLCEVCFDDGDARLSNDDDEPLRWRDLPNPPEYAPVAAPAGSAAPTPEN